MRSAFLLSAVIIVFTGACDLMQRPLEGILLVGMGLVLVFICRD